MEALYRLAEQLPESDRNQVQEFSRLYAQAVLEEEWPLLADSQASSHAQNTVEELRGSPPFVSLISAGRREKVQDDRVRLFTDCREGISVLKKSLPGSSAVPNRPLTPRNRGFQGFSKPNRGPDAGHGEFFKKSGVSSENSVAFLNLSEAC